MCDRQVSIRLGKGFWSRGPIPSVNWRAADFPSLQSQALGPDNLALLFQAQLELIQLFSNAHDILYSSAAHRKQLYLGGEYIRYIVRPSSTRPASNSQTDLAGRLCLCFAKMEALVGQLHLLVPRPRAFSLSAWLTRAVTPPVKASMVLSFEFLRLYINAFAFQATLNRAVARTSQRSSSIKAQAVGTLFSDVAGNPDARFIYESIDAANSLLSILNSFIDPVAGLKCMPLKYCLYVIYAAVFLFKASPPYARPPQHPPAQLTRPQARLAGAISGENDGGVRRAIQGTISQLQKSSNNPHSLGRRYATSLRLLWRKSSGKQGAKGHAHARRDSMREPPTPVQDTARADGGAAGADKALELDPLNGFSWRDLDSLGQYIASNAALSMTDGMLGPEFDWEHSSSGLDDLAMRPQFDNVWAGHDIIF